MDVGAYDHTVEKHKKLAIQKLVLEDRLVMANNGGYGGNSAYVKKIKFDLSTVQKGVDRLLRESPPQF